MNRISVRRLRAELRSRYKTSPDSSHGEDHRNSGIEAAIRVVNRLAGDVDSKARCRSDAERWCRTHFAYRGPRKSCHLAEWSWEWEKDVDWAEFNRRYQAGEADE